MVSEVTKLLILMGDLKGVSLPAPTGTTKLTRSEKSVSFTALLISLFCALLVSVLLPVTQKSISAYHIEVYLGS